MHARPHARPHAQACTRHLFARKLTLNALAPTPCLSLFLSMPLSLPLSLLSFLFPSLFLSLPLSSLSLSSLSRSSISLSPSLFPSQVREEVNTDENWWVDSAGNPWPELVDNHGKKWSQEEAEAFIKEGSVVYRDPELLGKNVPEPRTDTQGKLWKKE